MVKSVAKPQGFRSLGQLEKAVAHARDAWLAELAKEDVSDQIRDVLSVIYMDLLCRELGVLDVRHNPRLSHDSQLRSALIPEIAKKRDLILAQVAEMTSKVKISDKVIARSVNGIIAEVMRTVAATIAHRIVMDHMQKYAAENKIILTREDTDRVSDAVSSAAEYENFG